MSEETIVAHARVRNPNDSVSEGREKRKGPLKSVVPDKGRGTEDILETGSERGGGGSASSKDRKKMR